MAELTVINGSRSRKAGRKARTNLGRFRGLERRYWNGALTPEEQERFERIVYDAGRLYKQVRG